MLFTIDWPALVFPPSLLTVEKLKTKTKEQIFNPASPGSSLFQKDITFLQSNCGLSERGLDRIWHLLLSL